MSGSIVLYGLFYPLVEGDGLDAGECVKTMDIGKYGHLWFNFMQEAYPERYRSLVRFGLLQEKVVAVNEEAYEGKKFCKNVLIFMYIFAKIYIEINCNVITVLVWVKTLWTTVGGRISRHFFYLKCLRGWGNYMSELSIFIDESGDFGEVKERPAYYLVTMVFHNQAVDISKEIEKLEGKKLK